MRVTPSRSSSATAPRLALRSDKHARVTMMPRFWLPPVLLLVGAIIPAALMAAAAGVDVSVSPGAGQSLLFNGVDNVVVVEPSCGVTNQDIYHDAFTMSGWIRIPAVYNSAAFGSLDRHLFGVPYELGPRLFLARTGGGQLSYFSAWSVSTATTCLPANATHLNGVRFPFASAVVSDGTWRHVTLAHNTTERIIAVDGVVVAKCTAPNPTAVLHIPGASAVLNFGMFDTAIGSANSGPYGGWMESVRVWQRYLLIEEINAVMQQTALTDAQRVGLYGEWLFDSDTPATYTVTDTSGNARHGQLGSGKQFRAPSYHASDAPIAGPQRRFDIDSADNSTGAATAAAAAAAAVPVWLNVTSAWGVAPGALEVAVMAATANCDTTGAVAAVACALYTATGTAIPWATVTAVSASALGVVNGSMLVDSSTGLPYAGAPLLIVNTANGALQFRPDGVYVGTSVELVVVVRPVGSGVLSPAMRVTVTGSSNHAPVVGGGGYALKCDAAKLQYAYSSDFVWPRITVNTSDGVFTGGGAITVEWWGWVDASAEGDTSLWNIGNGESNAQWVDGFDPYHKNGRFFARAPFSSGDLQFFAGAGSSLVSVPLRPWYNQWNHFAMVHDGVTGTQQRMYLNGELVASGTHAHDGMGSTALANGIAPNGIVRSLSLCTWTFWSEVYHTGLIDEFRVFNVSRTTQEIRSTMSSKLTGTERGLYAYYDFDDLSPVAPPRTPGANPYVAKDLGPHNFDLYFGGCAPCIDALKGWMPYNSARGVVAPANASQADPNGQGYRVCLPSAKDPSSSFYVVSEVYGGAHCYGAEHSALPAFYPTRILSSAPVGGHVFPQFISYTTPKANIQLNGTDPDGARDAQTFRFVIVAVPTVGNLSWSDGVTEYPITAPNTRLPAASLGVVSYRPPPGMGGAPLTTLVYSATDGRLTAQAITVPLYVSAPAGTFLSANGSALATSCPAGTFSSTESLSGRCTPCAPNTFQPRTGQLTCSPCTAALSYQPATGASSCLACPIPTAAELTPGDDVTAAQLDVDTSRCDRYLSSAITDVTIAVRSADGVNVSGSSAGTSVPLMTYLTAAPRFATVWQVLPTSGPNAMHGEGDTNVLDAFYTTVTPTTYYASGVLGVSTPARAGHAPGAILGAPDVLQYGASANAWSPQPPSDGSSTVSITLQFPNMTYVKAVNVFVSYAVSKVSRIDAYNPGSSEWVTIWLLMDVDSALPPSTDGTLYTCTPSLCPTLFATDRLRLSFATASANGGVEVDSVSVLGVSARAQLGAAWLASDQLQYLPLSSVSGSTTTFSDTFAFVTRDCSSSWSAAAADSNPQSVTLKFVPPVTDTSRPSYERVLGILLLAFHVMATITSVVLVILKWNERSVGLQSPWLLLLTVLSWAFVLEAPINGIDFNGYPCGMTYWDVLWQPLLMTSVLMTMYRLYLTHTIQSLKRTLAVTSSVPGKFDAYHNRKAALRLDAYAQRSKRPLHMIGVWCGAMAVPLLVLVIAYGVETSPYGSGSGCVEDRRVDVIQVLFFTFYVMAMLCGVFVLRGVRDAFGLTARTGRFFLWYALISILYHVLKFTTSTSKDYRDTFDYRYLLWLICALYQTLNIISPLLALFPRFQAALDDSKAEAQLEEILATRLGFAYLYRHCSQEFSTENLLCWRAIEQFRRKTSVAVFRDIVEKYIVVGAYLQVNIGANTRDNVMRLYASMPAPPPAPATNGPNSTPAPAPVNANANAMPPGMTLAELQTSLDTVSTELTNLMRTDSLPRFMASPQFKLYQQKVPIGVNDDPNSADGASRTSPGFSMVPHSIRAGSVAPADDASVLGLSSIHADNGTGAKGSPGLFGGASSVASNGTASGSAARRANARRLNGSVAMGTVRETSGDGGAGSGDATAEGAGLPVGAGAGAGNGGGAHHVRVSSGSAGGGVRSGGHGGSGAAGGGAFGGASPTYPPALTQHHTAIEIGPLFALPQGGSNAGSPPLASQTTTVAASRTGANGIGGGGGSATLPPASAMAAADASGAGDTPVMRSRSRRAVPVTGGAGGGGGDNTSSAPGTPVAFGASTPSHAAAAPHTGGGGAASPPIAPLPAAAATTSVLQLDLRAPASPSEKRSHAQPQQQVARASS